MEPHDLELFSTHELIAELMRRKTFLGLVIHAEDEQKGSEWPGERLFKVHLNANLDLAEATRLLGCVAGYLDRNHT